METSGVLKSDGCLLMSNLLLIHARTDVSNDRTSCDDSVNSDCHPLFQTQLSPSLTVCVLYIAEGWILAL